MACRDRIHIRDLAVRAALGATRRERQERQPLLINISIEAGLSRAARSDSLSDSIDYSRIKKEIRQAAEGESFRTLARVAERAAAICLREPAARAVAVEVARDTAMLRGTGAGVRIARRRSGSTGNALESAGAGSAGGRNAR